MSRERMSREDWARLGLRMLGESGPAGITVEALCTAAGRTRGSLYHHFASHQALLEGILEFWHQHHTEVLIQAATGPKALSALKRLAVALDFSVETEVRRLVAARPDLRPFVAAVDDRRIAFLEDLHRPRMGREAALAAQLEYAAFLGFQQLLPPPSPEELQTLYEEFQKLLDGVSNP